MISCFVNLYSKTKKFIAHTLSPIIGPPLPPAMFRVSVQTDNTASIEWAKPFDDGGSPILHYILEKKGSTSANWETLTKLPPCVNECELENMAAGREYQVRLRAANKYGISEPKDLLEPITVKGVAKGRCQNDLGDDL